MPAASASTPSPVAGTSRRGGAASGSGFARARLFALLVPAALLTGALGSQYIGGLVPCEMCHWQRWPHYAALGLALAAFAYRPAARPLVLLAALAIVISGAIGVWHAGIELGVFEGVTRCTAQAAATAKDALTAILATPLVRCDQVQFAFLGISMAGWNALLSLMSGGVILWLSKR